MYLRRPVAQGGPRRLRLPAPFGARQPAADLRGVRARLNQVAPRQRDPGRRRARNGRGRDRRAGHPPDGAARSRHRGPARSRARSTTSWRVVREAAAANGERVLVTTLTKRMAEELTSYFSEVGRPLPLPPFRHRDPGPRRDPRGLPPGRLRLSHRHQPAARRARPARRSRSWRSSTPTRRGSSAARRRSSRRRAARRAT